MPALPPLAASPRRRRPSGSRTVTGGNCWPPPVRFAQPTTVRTTLWYTVPVFGEIMWTEESEAHIARHGISPDEVEQALYTRPRLVEPGKSETALVYCVTDAGRHLLVVVAEGLDGRDYVVTARDMTGNEKRAFRRRRQ